MGIFRRFHKEKELKQLYTTVTWPTANNDDNGIGSVRGRYKIFVSLKKWPQHTYRIIPSRPRQRQGSHPHDRIHITSTSSWPCIVRTSIHCLHHYHIHIHIHLQSFYLHCFHIFTHCCRLACLLIYYSYSIRYSTTVL